ncbi:MAG: hypothetical protein K5872_12695 [Rhizobiaceae bacterium]|nr:hypothetical protein [Rhizobiaceae bacterium]MCV0407075.1 hypothetical protein [Rhizobiaceae bacterium]
MRRVAIFGNAGGGKSTLARRLSVLTGLPHFAIDTIRYRPGGGEVPIEEYLGRHAELLDRPEWIMDGFGTFGTTWERLAVADTLIHVDLPLSTHYRWVSKRLLTGLFKTPEGWPEDSPIWRSTMNSYRTIWRCHRHLTPRYRQYVADAAGSKRVHHLTSPAAIAAFVDTTRRQAGCATGG